jgi:hypothetical protein
MSRATVTLGQGGATELIGSTEMGLHMSSFTELEEAALHAIFAETPALAPMLEQQLEKAAVANRENTGAGFFTTIVTSEGVPQVNTPRVLGNETYARIEGLTYGLGFVLFMENGRLHLLEGHELGGESTARLELEKLTFAITRTPQ